MVAGLSLGRRGHIRGGVLTDFAKFATRKLTPYTVRDDGEAKNVIKGNADSRGDPVEMRCLRRQVLLIQSLMT